MSVVEENQVVTNFQSVVCFLLFYAILFYNYFVIVFCYIYIFNKEFY